MNLSCFVTTVITLKRKQERNSNVFRQLQNFNIKSSWSN